MKNLFFMAALIVMGSTAVNAQFDPFCNIDSINTNGQDCVNSIITAVPFLRIIPDARSGAMGDVGIGLSPDANSIHFNSSKLAFVKDKGSLSLTYTPWLRSLALNDVYLAYASGYYSPDDLQTFAASIRYFSLGQINFTDANGESLGTGNPNEFEIAASYNRKLSQKLALGITPKFIYSNLASDQTVGSIEVSAAVTGAVDFSGTYISDINLGEKDGSLTLGAAISNLGGKVTYTKSINRDYLPANLGLGGALNLNLDEFNSLTFAFDVNKLLVPTPTTENSTGDPTIPDYKEYSMFEGVIKSFGDAPGGFSEEMRELMYSVGVEYLYDQQFAVRAGYYAEHATKGGRKYFTVGLGLKYNIFGLNFSYLVPTTNQRNPLDNTLRFSLIFNFGDEGVTE